MYTPKAVNAISQEAVPDTRLDSPCPVDIEWTHGFDQIMDFVLPVTKTAFVGSRRVSEVRERNSVKRQCRTRA